MASCVMCGSPLPDNQGSRTCSICYGDIDHGKDGYYREWAEEQERQHREREQSDERQARAIRPADASSYFAPMGRYWRAFADDEE